MKEQKRRKSGSPSLQAVGGGHRGVIHDYWGTMIVLAWLVLFWHFSTNRVLKRTQERLRLKARLFNALLGAASTSYLRTL